MIKQPWKIASPLTTVLLVPFVQESTPPAGLEAIERLMTVELSLVTMLPLPSYTATIGCTAQTAPAAPPPGWIAKPRCFATEGAVMLNAWLVTVRFPSAASVAVRV